MMRVWLACLLFLLGDMPANAQETAGEETPLFADDSILEVTITGPVQKIARRAEKSTDPYPARLDAAGESHAIMLSARGKSRRLPVNCSFPPLRIAFAEKAGSQSLFYRQGRIKLVTHCRDRDSLEQTLLREYATYRLYSVVAPQSLRVRLARIRYIDGDKLVTQRLGFFIEDVDDAARRLGRKEIDTTDISVAWLDQRDAARYALFQYMIGNTDWSMVLSPAGERCCHNSRLLGADSDTRRQLTPIPYDFDNSGFVDATYAVPNHTLSIKSVRTRLYRGFCSFNDLVPAEAERFRTLQSALFAEIEAIPETDTKTRAAMRRYLEGFFEDISDTERLERKLLRKCR